MRILKLRALPAIFITLITVFSIFSPALTKPAQAAGETFTWTSFTQITGSGGGFSGQVAFTQGFSSPINPVEVFTNVNITHTSGCSFALRLTPTSSTRATVSVFNSTNAAQQCSTTIT